jgi:type I restriction enzyme S subunit
MRAWEETTLRELIDIKHGYAFKGEFFTEVPNGNALLTPGNFHIGGGFKSDKFKYYIGDIPEEYVLIPGDVIVTMTDLSKDGDTLGYSARIPESTNRFLHNQRLGLVSVISKKADVNFIYWLLRTRHYQKTIVNSCSGSTVKHTSPSRIKDYKFRLPPITEQVAINKVLSSFDRKIENLRKQNETLETIAQTLFKHWFVDFEFPNEDGKLYKSSGGEMVRSELGKIPAGWCVGKLGDIGKNIKNGINEDEIQSDMNYIALEHMPQKQIALDLWSTAGGIASNKFVFQKGNILFGKLRPYFHKVGVAFISGICSTDILVLDSKCKELFSFLLMILSSDALIKYVSLASEGTRMPRTSWGYMKEYPICIPNNSVVSAFNTLVKVLINKIENNIFQIQTLTKTRDLLLPQLMSGKLRITE